MQGFDLYRQRLGLLFDLGLLRFNRLGKVSQIGSLFTDRPIRQAARAGHLQLDGQTAGLCAESADLKHQLGEIIAQGGGRIGRPPGELILQVIYVLLQHDQRLVHPQIIAECALLGRQLRLSHGQVVLFLEFDERLICRVQVVLGLGELCFKECS